MQLDISKRCADSLRAFSLEKFGVQIKSSHAHELVAAYMGYGSRAAMLADTEHPITNLKQADILVLTPTAPIKERRTQLDGLPTDLPDDIAEGVYLPLYDEKWILHKIWPTLEYLGKALADQHIKSKPLFFSDQAVQREGVNSEFHNGEVAIVVFREYVSPRLTLSSMKNVTRGVVDVFQLSRIACHIGYVLANHHSVDAETLDEAIVKMRDVYHQIISSAPSFKDVKSPEKPKPNFAEWLAKHKKRESPLGDLARRRDFLNRDAEWPVYDNLKAYKEHLENNYPPRGTTAALEQAWKTYHAFLKRKPSLNPITDRKKPSKIKSDSRKIVHVKNVQPLHFSKRTIEQFVADDKAWISWDGIKAIPVTVLEVDERYYTFKIERPLKNAGEKLSLRLDEVRSTPELACINMVTF